MKKRVSVRKTSVSTAKRRAPCTKRVPGAEPQSGAQRQARYRDKIVDTQEQAIRHAVEVAQKRVGDHKIHRHQVARAFWLAKGPDLLTTGSKMPSKSSSTPAKLNAFKREKATSLPEPNDPCMYVKTERGLQYIMCDNCVCVAREYSCGYEGESYVIFRNLKWNGNERKPTKRRPNAERFVAIRSMHVARIPKEQQDDSWLMEIFGPKTRRCYAKRSARRKPAKVPRTFKDSIDVRRKRASDKQDEKERIKKDQKGRKHPS